MSDNKEKIVLVISAVLHSVFFIVSVLVGFFMGKSTGSHFAGNLSSVIMVMFIYYMLARKQLHLEKKQKETISTIIDFSDKLNNYYLQNCIEYNHPYIGEGWGCCYCRSVNNNIRNLCRECGHNKCGDEGK